MHTPPSAVHHTPRVVHVLTLVVLLISLAGSSRLGSLRPGDLASASVMPLFTKPALAVSRRVASGTVPAGLQATEWAAIQAQIATPVYHPTTAVAGYQAVNPAHGWQITYGNNGSTTLTTTSASAWRWGLRLLGYGAQPHRLTASGGTLHYQWPGGIDEWWSNTPNGLEQGFSLPYRPVRNSTDAVLRLDLALTGDLQARQQGTNLTFTDTTGKTVLTYSQMQAWDATGRALPSRISLADAQLVLEVDDAGAIYPLTIDPLIRQAYLKASNTEANDSFGSTVALDADILAVGAPNEGSSAIGVNGNQSDNSAGSAGAVYVFARSGTTWNQQAYLKASNTEMGDRFGWAVAISGDTLVIGAPWESSSATGVNGNQSDNSASSAGAAYVFTRSGTTWSQQAYLKASNTEAGDNFGISVAISGDTILVGTPGEDSSATGVNGTQSDNSASAAGAAYVFTRSGTIWSQQAYLKASNTETGDNFGISVAISGDTIAVGSPWESSNATGANGDQNDNSTSAAGAAYVFARSGSTWSQQAYLKASNTGLYDSFGWAVAISGDTTVVGARGEASSTTGVNGDQNDNSASTAGAAYVFVRGGATWSQQAYLKASNAARGDWFGWAVLISGDMLVIGAPGEASNATGVNGNQSNNSSDAAGAVYVFTRSGATWSQQSYLKAFNTEMFDGFGQSVTISGDTIVVGTNGEDSNATGVNGNQRDNSATSAGAAYVFAAATHKLGLPMLAH